MSIFNHEGKLKSIFMKNYNYEARNEDKPNNSPGVFYPAEELNARIIPVHDQLTQLEYAIETLSKVQRNLLDRLMWVSNPCDRPSPEFCDGETKSKSGRPESEIVQRIKKSVKNIRELQYNLSIQLEDLDV